MMMMTMMKKIMMLMMTTDDDDDDDDYDEQCPIELKIYTCLAIALAVFWLSPVSKMTSRPISLRVLIARWASDFTVSATANIAIITPVETSTLLIKQWSVHRDNTCPFVACKKYQSGKP